MRYTISLDNLLRYMSSLEEKCMMREEGYCSCKWDMLIELREWIEKFNIDEQGDAAYEPNEEEYW